MNNPDTELSPLPEAPKDTWPKVEIKQEDEPEDVVCNGCQRPFTAVDVLGWTVECPSCKGRSGDPYSLDPFDCLTCGGKGKVPAFPKVEAAYLATSVPEDGTGAKQRVLAVYPEMEYIGKIGWQAGLWNPDHIGWKLMEQGFEPQVWIDFAAKLSESPEDGTAMKSGDELPVGIACDHCDFASGYRGMDRCGKCDGNGFIPVVKPVDPEDGTAQPAQGETHMEAISEFQMVLAISRIYPTMSVFGPADSTGGQWSVFANEWKNYRIGWADTRLGAIEMAFKRITVAPSQSKPTVTLATIEQRGDSQCQTDSADGYTMQGSGRAAGNTQASPISALAEERSTVTEVGDRTREPATSTSQTKSAEPKPEQQFPSDGRNRRVAAPSADEEIFKQQGDPQYARFRKPEPVAKMSASPAPNQLEGTELPALDDECTKLLETLNPKSWADEGWRIRYVLACRERQLQAALAENSSLRGERGALMQTINHIAGGAAQGMMLHAKTQRRLNGK